MAQSDDVLRKLLQFIERTMRRLQLRIYQVLTTSTPVLTGFARAGWSPSATAPDPGPSERPAVAAVATAQAAALFSQHQQAAQALAAGYRLQQGAVFIVNSVGYLLFLNQGTSAQAPAMFVERAVEIGVAATRAEIA